MREKTRKEVRTQMRNVKHNSHAATLLKVLRATGFFRWERPVTHAESVMNIMTHGIGIGLAIAGLAMLVYGRLFLVPYLVPQCSFYILALQCVMQ